MHCTHLYHLLRSFPAVIKGKPKATVELVLQLLVGLLPKLDVDAQVGGAQCHSCCTSQWAACRSAAAVAVYGCDGQPAEPEAPTTNCS